MSYISIKVLPKTGHGGKLNAVTECLYTDGDGSVGGEANAAGKRLMEKQSPEQQERGSQSPRVRATSLAGGGAGPGSGTGVMHLTAGVGDLQR